MSSLAIAGLVFACIFAAALLTMFLGRALPTSHLSSESKDVVKLGLGVIATLTALVLGLLIASAKGTYDTQSNSVKQMSASVMLLDRLLVRYGSETKEARELLQRALTIILGTIWPEDGGLMAPRNATVVVVLIVCALSFSAALFLILELDRPFDGVMRVSSTPFRDALSQAGK